jgi:hypothetical protein
MKTRLFLTSTAVLAATLLTGSVQASEQPLPTGQEVNGADAAIRSHLATSVPDLTVTPTDARLAFASHESHSSHASHSSHSSHTSSSFV